MKHLLFIVAILLFTGTVDASDKFRHYNVINGLSGSDVTSICENENFLWIATTDGLNRFDGRNFKVFKREIANENSLSENSIETMMFDSRGLLWIGLKTGGVDVYDPRKDKFTHISHFTEGEVPNRVIAIFEDSEHNIWLGSWGNGVYKLTPESGEELSFRSENHFAGYVVSTITEIPSGFIWTGTYTGYHIYSLKNKKWENNSNLEDLVITSFLRTDEKNKLWCSTWGNGLIEFSWNGHIPENIEAKNIYRNDIYAIYRLSEGSENKLYMGTWGEGLLMMDKRQPDQIHSMREESFTSPLIYALYEDKMDRLWIGTYGDGLYCYDSSEKGISFIPTDENARIPTPVGNMIPIGHNSLLAGTLGSGFWLCNPKENTLVHKYFAPEGRAYENNTLALYNDGDLVIAGHDGNGLLYGSVQDIHKSSVGFRTFYATHLEKVTAIYKGTDERIWLGTKQDGLMSVTYNARKESFENFTNYSMLWPDEITGFIQQDSQYMFISSHAGLFLFDAENNQLKEDKGMISSEMIYCMEKDRKNNCLWIGSSVGMRRMKLDGEYQLEQPFPAELVPRGTVKDMVLDDDNNLWFIVGGLIFCYVEKENNIRQIDITTLNGRPAVSCALTRTDGRPWLIFGSTSDFILLDPATVSDEDTATKVVFTELQIDHRTVSVGEEIYGSVVLEEETEYTSSLALSYRCRWISFVMAQTDKGIWKTNFQYRIRGFSDSWQYLDISYPITFSQLNPGNYVLELRSVDGQYNTSPCWSMSLSVSYPWWRTGWFYVALVLAGLGLIISGFLLIRRYYKKRQMQRLSEIEKKKKEELLHEKESFFAGLSHDLTTPFSLIIAPTNDLLRDDKVDKPIREKLEIIGKNATFLSDLFTTILDLKRAETSNLELKEKQIEVISFIRIITNAFDYLARSRNINLSFHSTIKTLPVVIDNIKLERVVYNLLSNAIKYTPDGGEVSVVIGYSVDNGLSINITDSGPGIETRNREKVFEKFYREAKYVRDEKSKGLGLGLYIVRQFVTLLNGEIEMDSSSENGTCITIRLNPVIVNEETSQEVEIQETRNMEIDRTTILIVEDNNELRIYLGKRLSEQFHVISVPDGNEALRVIGESLPEIVISDIMMPGMDGLELTQKIKANPLYADIFVILLTALSSSDDERKGYKAGADIYLKKPFDTETLVNQIMNISNTRLRRRQQLLRQLVSPSEEDIGPDSKNEFLRCSMKVVEDHLMDADFKIDEFAAEMNLSKTVLHRKFKLLVGQTPNQFIRTIRLRKAAGMLLNTDLTIAEIAYLTGFNQSHYFIKCFRELYNDTPNNYKKQKR